MRVAVHPRYPGWVRIKADRDCRVYRVTRLEEIEGASRDLQVEAHAELLIDTLVVAK